MKKQEKNKKPFTPPKKIDISEQIDDDIQFSIDVLSAFKTYPMKNLLVKIYKMKDGFADIKNMTDGIMAGGKDFGNISKAMNLRHFTNFKDSKVDAIEKLMEATKKDLESCETDKEHKEILMKFYKNIFKTIFPEGE